MSEVTASMLEHQLAEFKAAKANKELIERLIANPDFRKAIIEGFCKTEAARYVQESCDPALSAEARADALEMAKASGHLKRWLLVQIQMGETADRNIVDCEENLAELRAQEGAE